MIKRDNCRQRNPNAFETPLIHCGKINETSHVHGNVTLMELGWTFAATHV